MIAGFHGRIVNGALDSGSIDIQRATRRAKLGELDDRSAQPPALSDAPEAAIEIARGDVFAERSVEQREAERGQIVNAFRRDDEESLARTAAERGMSVAVAFDAERSDETFLDGTLRHAPAGDVDLDH